MGVWYHRVKELTNYATKHEVIATLYKIILKSNEISKWLWWGYANNQEGTRMAMIGEAIMNSSFAYGNFISTSAAL